MSVADARSAAQIAGISVSCETIARLAAYIETLDAWRMKSNLIGPREWPSVWSRHVADSLQLLSIIERPRALVDLGSGAGFPGLVLAAALAPDTEVSLVEATAKKCVFLRAAAEAANLDVTIHAERAERLAGWEVDFVTARAVAPLSKLLDFSAPWMKKGARGLFHKGEGWREELTAARERWSFACRAVPSRTSDSGAILEISEVSRDG